MYFQDLNELELPKTCKTEFPDVDDLLNFKLIIYPDEVSLGYYLAAIFPSLLENNLYL